MKSNCKIMTLIFVNKFDAALNGPVDGLLGGLNQLCKSGWHLSK